MTTPEDLPSRWALEHLVGVVPAERVRVVANSHRAVMRIWLLQSVLVAPATIRAASLAAAGVDELMLLLIPLAMISILLTLRLRLALGDPTIQAIACGAIAGIPGLNVLAIPLLSVKARSFLWPRVGRIPLLGFSRRTVDAWDSLCDGCGYDLARTTSTRCPECGQESPDLPESP